MQQNGYWLCLLFNRRNVCVSDDLYFESILVLRWFVDTHISIRKPYQYTEPWLIDHACASDVNKTHDANAVVNTAAYIRQT